MKVLFLSRLFYPHIGGVEKHVYELSRVLIKKGYKVTVVTEQYKEDLKKSEAIERIKIYRIPQCSDSWFKKFFIWSWLWKNRKIIKSSDIIHCHDIFYWYLPFRFLYPNKKVFTTFHGYESYPVTKRAIFVRRISEFLSLGNICIGAFIQKWYGTHPDYIMYGGVKQKSNIKNQIVKIKKFSAVFIGRLDEQTSVREYVNAYEKIKELIPQFALLVVGDGSHKKYIPKGVYVLPFTHEPWKETKEFHFAFVSRYLSILEAMMARRLVFAFYDNQIKKDYLTMTPFAQYIVIASSASELAKKVQYYLNHPSEEKKLIDTAFSWVKSQSWENVLKIYLALWSR